MKPITLHSGQDENTAFISGDISDIWKVMTSLYEATTKDTSDDIVARYKREIFAMKKYMRGGNTFDELQRTLYILCCEYISILSKSTVKRLRVITPHNNMLPKIRLGTQYQIGFVLDKEGEYGVKGSLVAELSPTDNEPDKFFEGIRTELIKIIQFQNDNYS